MRGDGEAEPDSIELPALPGAGAASPLPRCVTIWSQCIHSRRSAGYARLHARRHCPCPRDLIHSVLDTRSPEHHVQ